MRQNNVERKDGTDILRALRCPLLVLCGENDALTPLVDHRVMAALVPGSSLVVVPDSGHMTPLEQPEAVTRALRDWLGAS